MATYIIITRLLPDASRDLPKAAALVAKRIKAECPKVKWRDSYATLGELDVIDIVEADKPADVSKAAMIIREVGRGNTQTLTAIPWKEFISTLAR
jgi:uncharacterized protein with GYD domain